MKKRDDESGPNLPEVVELDAMTPENVRGAYVVRFGPMCAAWLCNRFRRMTKKYGAFAFHLPSGEEEPRWVGIAVQYLRDYRARKWGVMKIQESDGRMRYRVMWRLHRKRVIPELLRPWGKA